jgi:CubicO group peptidase (beta-lactamase class C family)
MIRHPGIDLVLFLSVSMVLSGQAAAQLYFPPTVGSAWETVSPASLGWNTAYIDSLRDYLAAQNSRAFVLLKDGKIAIEQYFGTFTRDSAWYWASAGKTLTSVLVGIAQQEGSLKISDTTSRWLGKGWTSTAPANEGMITIRHQLTMTTGLDDGVGDPYCTDKSCLVYKADPGTRWAYHNAPYTLLDSVVRSASGLTLNQFFQTRIAVKTGMSGLFFKSGYNNVFASTARSMARFGLLILNRGVWNTTPVLSDTAYFRAMTTTSQQLNLSYGYLWWLNGKGSFMVPQTQIVFPGSMTPSAPPDMIAALGKNGQFVNVVPSMKLVFIRMGDAPDNSMVPFQLNEEIWKRLNRVFGATGVDAEREAAGEDGMTMGSYPNPFNASTVINAQLSTAGWVKLAVYDPLGREVAVLDEGYRGPGELRVSWEARGLASGFYVCRLRSGQRSITRALILVR